MSVGPNGVSVRERRSGVIVLSVIGGIGLLLSLVGAVTTGAAGFLIFFGITAVVLGLGAVIVGRPAWALIGSRKIGAVVLAVGVVLAVIGGMLAPAPDPKIVEPQALLEPLATSSTSSSPATTSTGANSTSPSSPPTEKSAALASSVAAVAAAAESERLVVEQATQAAAAAEASRVAAEAAAGASAVAQGEADRVAAEASAAAQAEADRVAVESAAQAEAARQAKTLADQQDAQRNAPVDAAPSGGYANCAAARAAGAAPVYRGEPGYAPRLDGDDDGIGCDKG